MRALLYTLVLGAILLGSIILMQRFTVTQPVRRTPTAGLNREPVASVAPVDMSNLSPAALREYSITELYETGVEFLEQWHVPEARAVFENVIKQDSSYINAYVKLAECHADPLLFNELLVARSLELARQIETQDTTVIAAMRNLYLEGDYEGAADKLRRVLRVREDDLGVRYHLALAHFRGGRLRDAQTVIEAILARDESHGRARALLVEILAKKGQGGEAELLAKDLASLYPGEPYPYIVLARIQLQLGRVEDAIEFSNNALKMDQRYGPAIIARGNLYAEVNEYEAARVTFQKLLMFDEPVVAAAAWESIANIDFLSGNFDEAVEGMDEAIQLANGAGSSLRAAATLFRLVNYLCELGQGETARSVFSKWSSSIGVVPAQFGRLRFQIYYGDFPRARLSLAEIEATESHRRLMDLLEIDYDELAALIYIKERKYNEAIELLMGEEISDTSYYFLGFASFQSGLAERASSYFKGALGRRMEMQLPYHGDPVLLVQSLFYLAETSIAIGRVDEARIYYRRFLDHWGDASWELQAVTRAREKLETLAAARE